jgi:hypothetical protein
VTSEAAGRGPLKIACALIPAAATAVSVGLLGKEFLDGVLYLVFFATLVLAAGCTYVMVLSEGMGKVGTRGWYRLAARRFLRLDFIASGLCLVALIASIASSGLRLTALSAPFSLKFFGGILTLIVALSLGHLVALAMFARTWAQGMGRRKAHLFVGGAACCLITGAVAAFNLIGTYMSSPALPDGLLAVLRLGSLGWLDQVSLMVNRAWLPLTLKMLLVGALSSALILSAVAVLKHRSATGEARDYWAFEAGWDFKAALLFGAPVGLVGYWTSGILHASVPTIALGLMGETTGGLSDSLVSALNPLWHLGIIGAMTLAACAVVFYLDVGRAGRRQQDDAARVDRRLILLSLAFLAIGIEAAADVSISFPKQGVLAIFVLIGGYAMVQSLWLFSKGRMRLEVPILIFAAACLALLLYIGPYTKWFLAAKYGGVPWPPIAFVAAIALGLLIVRKIRLKRFVLPLVAGFLAPAIFFMKFMDTVLLKGATLVAIDPAARSTVDSWAYANYVNISPVLKEYPTLQTGQAVIAVILAYAIFLCLFAFLHISEKREVYQP